MIKYTEKTLANYTFIEMEKDGIISNVPIDESNSEYQAYLRWLENPEAGQEQLPN